MKEKGYAKKKIKCTCCSSFLFLSKVCDFFAKVSIKIGSKITDLSGLFVKLAFFWSRLGNKCLDRAARFLYNNEHGRNSSPKT